MTDSQKLLIDKLETSIEGCLDLFNTLYPDNKLTIEDVIKHLQDNDKLINNIGTPM